MHYPEESVILTEHISKNIKALCKKYRMTPESLSKTLRVNRGRKLPKNYTLLKVIKYATYFGISLDDLIFKTWYKE